MLVSNNIQDVLNKAIPNYYTANEGTDNTNNVNDKVNLNDFNKNIINKSLSDVNHECNKEKTNAIIALDEEPESSKSKAKIVHLISDVKIANKLLSMLSKTAKYLVLATGSKLSVFKDNKLVKEL